jgi:hypothetical protein
VLLWLVLVHYAVFLGGLLRAASEVKRSHERQEHSGNDGATEPYYPPKYFVEESSEVYAETKKLGERLLAAFKPSSVRRAAGSPRAALERFQTGTQFFDAVGIGASVGVL